MIEKLNYISEAELERLINQVEREELVTAPPDLMEHILEAAGMSEEETASLMPMTPAKNSKTKKKEFTAYCFRVITSVAAAVALVFLLPHLTEWMNLNGTVSSELFSKSEVVQAVPSKEEIVSTNAVPRKEEVVTEKAVPRKEDVLDDTGFFEKVISDTAEWLKKEKNKE